MVTILDGIAKCPPRSSVSVAVTSRQSDRPWTRGSPSRSRLARKIPLLSGDRSDAERTGRRVAPINTLVTISAIIFGPRRIRRRALIGLAPAMGAARRVSRSRFRRPPQKQNGRRVRPGGPLPPTSRNYPLAIIPWVATKSALQNLCWLAPSHRGCGETLTLLLARSRFRRTCGARAHHKTKRPPSRPLTDPLSNHFSPGNRCQSGKELRTPARHPLGFSLSPPARRDDFEGLCPAHATCEEKNSNDRKKTTSYCNTGPSGLEPRSAICPYDANCINNPVTGRNPVAPQGGAAVAPFSRYSTNQLNLPIQRQSGRDQTDQQSFRAHAQNHWRNRDVGLSAFQRFGQRFGQRYERLQ